jgi:hypothetical protein
VDFDGGKPPDIGRPPFTEHKGASELCMAAAGKFRTCARRADCVVAQIPSKNCGAADLVKAANQIDGGMPLR